MIYEDPSKRMTALQRLMTEEARKVNAAEMISKAKLRMLDAAVMLGDKKAIEVARQESATAFEAFLDIRIASHRRVMAATDELRG